MATTSYIMGPEVKELEKKLAAYTGAKHAISCASGTDALLMALMAYGVKPGDAIFTTPFTFIATAEVISLLGATPVFVDIDPKTFNIDPAKLDLAIKALKANDPSIYPLPNIEHRTLNLEHSSPVEPTTLNIEHRTSNIEHSSPVEPRTLNLEQSSSVEPRTLNLEQSSLVEPRTLNIEQSSSVEPRTLNLEQSSSVEPRTLNIEHSSFVTPHIPAGNTSAWAQYSLLARDEDHRTALLKKLQDNKIPSAIYYPKPLHMQTAFASLGYEPGAFPVSKDVAGRIFSLPMHPYLEQKNQAFIAGFMV